MTREDAREHANDAWKTHVNTLMALRGTAPGPAEKNSVRTNTMGGPVPLTTEDWARGRYEYESIDRKLSISARSAAPPRAPCATARWGWTRSSSGPAPSEGPPLIVVPVIVFQAPQGSPLTPPTCP